MAVNSIADMDTPIIYSRKPKREWLWLPVYVFGILFFYAGLGDDTSLLIDILRWSMITLFSLVFIATVVEVFVKRNRLVLDDETVSYRYMGITYKRRWEDVDNFRPKSILGETMIVCDVLRPTGPIDAILGTLGRWKGVIVPEFEGVNSETLVAQLNAMKANSRYSG